MNAQRRELDRVTGERDDAVRALGFERTRLVALLQKAAATVAVVRGPTHVFEFANEAFCELSGRHDVVGKPMIEVFPELEQQGFIQLLDRVFTTGEPFIAKRIPVKASQRAGAEPVQFYAN